MRMLQKMIYATHVFKASLFVILVSSMLSVALGQSAAKNRQDERLENQRVEKARNELTQTQREVTKLQSQLQQKIKEHAAANGSYLQAKKKADVALEQAKDRVGETLGIPAQTQAFRSASVALQEKTKGVLSKLKSTDEYSKLEASNSNDKKALRALEEAAIGSDPEVIEAKRDLEEAQKRLKEMKAKLSPTRIESDFAYKRAKLDAEQALKKLHSASAGLRQAEVALQKKVSEVGGDYQAYLKARQADAADPNRTKPKAMPKQSKKPTTKKPTPKKPDQGRTKTN